MTTVEVRHALSPSRASDFLNCPLLYRFRTIDRLPEDPDPVAVRGTLVHAVLERLFSDQPAERTPERAHHLLPEAWAALIADHPDLADLALPDDWLSSANDLLDAYFELEDPRRVHPAATELRVDHKLESGLSLGGVIDRLDVADDGRIRVVDFKTGRAPSERFEDKSLFQMKFYALVIWRTRGVLPSLLQLYYLADRTVLSYEPAESDLLATERKLVALWSAINAAIERQEFRARPSALCQWCGHQDKCPEFGAAMPPMPTVTIVDAASAAAPVGNAPANIAAPEGDTMTQTPDESHDGQALSDDDLITEGTQAPTEPGGDADGTDADGTDGDSTDATDGDGTDADGTDADGTDGTDGAAL